MSSGRSRKIVDPKRPSPRAPKKWAVFAARLRTGRRRSFFIQFHTDELQKFNPFLCFGKDDAGFELDTFMNANMELADMRRYDVYLCCVNFVAFLDELIQAWLCLRVTFVAALDQQGQHLPGIEHDVKTACAKGIEPHDIQFQRLDRLVYRVTPPKKEKK